MRSESIRLAFLSSFLLMSAHAAFALQSLTGSLSYVGKPKDDRPFGKFLHALCTVSGGAPGRCEVVDQRTTSELKLDPIAQSMSITPVCGFAASSDCTPPYPLQKGSDFYLRATSDSGNPVILSLFAGPAILRDVQAATGATIARFSVTGAGMIVIHATAAGNDTYLAASPIDIFLQSAATADDIKAAACTLLPAPKPVQSSGLDAPTIVALLGNPTPFVAIAQSPSVIAIYTTRQNPNDLEKGLYKSLLAQIATLTDRRAGSLGNSPAAKPFTVELRIPHASALGDLATRIATLNFSQFTLQDVGRDSIRITSPAIPDCKTWTAFLGDIRHMEWQLVSEPMNLKLFYLSSSDAAAAFSSLSPGGGSPSSGGTSGTTGNSGASGGGGSAPAPSGTASGGASPAAASAGSPSAASGSSATGTSTFAVSQPTGSIVQLTSDTTACLAAGLAGGNPSVCGPAPSAVSSGAASSSSSSSPTGSTSPSAPAPAAPAPLAMASVAVAAGIGEQTPPDLLVFSDSNPGDDAQVAERLRILAQLDLPRPEMIISAWVAQDSSTKQETVAGFNNRVKTLVNDYNDAVGAVVLRGWNQIKADATDPNYFNKPFRRYISDLFIADTFKSLDQTESAQEIAQDYLDHSQATIAAPRDADYREKNLICDPHKYCLGYTNVLRDRELRPSLTKLLIALIASQDPVGSANRAIDAVEVSPTSADVTLGREWCRNAHCKVLWDVLSLDHNLSRNDDARKDDVMRPGCTARDQIGTLTALFAANDDPKPRMYLECFRQAVNQLLVASGTNPPYPAGMLRAALANFLFNYKMSQEFPHEFVAYDLTASANDLNAALSPIIDAFNRDLMSFQAFVRADLSYHADLLNRFTSPCCVKRLFGLDKPSFYNDGLVSVRTISGQQTIVNTTSQSYLDASTAPQLSALLSAFAQPGGSAGTSAIPFLGAHPGAVAQSLAAALAQYQTTTAQIGRALNLTVTPRSLTTASSAELQVTLLADDSASGSALPTGAGANNPSTNTSRVSQHDVTTRVRVDSVKLFEISSFTAIVERSHSRFPLLPPFVEIPYIGTFAGVPIGPAREFHSSAAIMSAFVVPTAADLAYGLRFQHDLLLDAANTGPCSYLKGVSGPAVKNACVYRYIYSPRDLGVSIPPLREYNREMIQCFEEDTSPDGCSKITFDDANNVASY